MRALIPENMKRKASESSLNRIMNEGSLTEQKGSKWLLNFWGKKTGEGLIFLPITRHRIMHLAVCKELKDLLNG